MTSDYSTLQLTPQLTHLLNWGIQRMTPEGETHFRALMEEAVSGVVTLAFKPDELRAFHVEKMTGKGRMASERA